MAENLGKRPSKGILKTSSSFDNQEAPSRASKETKWDEMNIIATLHPADKDYGHMKINEPKTPYNYVGVPKEGDHIDSSAVAMKLEKNLQPKIFEASSEEEDEETPEEKERRKIFEAKRKGHYREWEAVQLARKKLIEEEDDDDDDNDNDDNRDGNHSAVTGNDTEDDSDNDVETADEENITINKSELKNEEEDGEIIAHSKDKCVPSSENKIASE